VGENNAKQLIHTAHEAQVEIVPCVQLSQLHHLFKHGDNLIILRESTA